VDHEAEVGLHQLALGLGIAGLDPAGQRLLVLGR
jgi:hypothetical protein